MTPARLATLAALLTLLGAGCQNGGNFKVLGYSTEPPFDPDIRTVYIPVFKTTAFHATPHRGIEVDLTEAIVAELAARRTPIRVVSDPALADTELIGTITTVSKGVQNRNLQNFNREFDLTVTCQVSWRDLRTGRSLANSRPPKPPAQVANPFDPTAEPPPPPAPDVAAVPLSVTGYGRVLPELGESNATGQQAAIKQIASQIVNMMERPW